ncbi:exonuclease domain-containing protein [Caldalkalibacillus horti]|uniref:DNA polymerase-3 subunit epsilon n=1 Tax=Caldalkalibacillus horti TaxID=77523 RepID=A0ABT9VWR0_9BACI|nr:exonuclease domain-containing protein [Bacillus horti]MDQ0165416.1 DNA polymerase-3 subunit epsilon [Bacillus horti]
MKINQVVQMMKQWSTKLPMFLTSVPDQMRAEHLSYVRQLKKELSKDYFQLPLQELKVVVFDFETSGFFPDQGDQILSIGAIKVEGTTLSAESFYSCVFTEELPSAEILDLTGLSPAELQAAPAIDDILPKFFSFCEQSMLVAHHAQHERAFLQQATQKLYQLPFQQRIVDTSLLMKLFQTWKTPPTLDFCCEAFGVPITHRHHAFEDAVATAKLWIAYLEEFKKRNFETLQDVYSEIAKK